MRTKKSLPKMLEALAEDFCTLQIKGPSISETKLTAQKLSSNVKKLNSMFFAIGADMPIGFLLLNLVYAKWDVLVNGELKSLHECEKVRNTLIEKSKVNSELMDKVIEFVETGTQICARGLGSPKRMIELTLAIDKLFKSLPQVPMDAQPRVVVFNVRVRKNPRQQSSLQTASPAMA